MALDINEVAKELEFAEAIGNTDGCILIGDLAKILKQNGFETGRNRLFKLLRKEGYLTKDNSPTQKSMDLGVFRMKQSPVDQGVKKWIGKTTIVTVKGQKYFIRFN